MQTHETLSSTPPPKVGSNRNFGLVFATVFTLIALIPLFHQNSPRWWAAAIAAAFLLISLIAPALLGPFNKAWHHFGLLLGNIVAPVVMGLVFLLALTPIGALMRLTGKDPLSRRFDPQATSYWVPKEATENWAESLKNQF